MTAPSQSEETLLGPLRVLDLAGGGTQLCGKILGDLGADVVKLEPPGGDPARNMGPFYKDIPDPEKSLFWFAFNANKRGITLNIETADGQEMFRRLVKGADFVIESFDPGYMDSLGLGYGTLKEINPGCIVASITPFGQSGPYSRHKASDLTLWAMSGYLYLSGDIDRPPVWISIPQAYLNGGAEAAAACMIAHWHRQATGVGQHIDVSVQECLIRLLMNAAVIFDVGHTEPKRVGYSLMGTKVNFRTGWPCRDGYIGTYVQGGGATGLVASTKAWVKWMDEEGMAPDWMKKMDWAVDYDASKLTQDVVARTEQPFVEFFKTKPKAELYEEGLKRGIIVVPVSTVQDMAQDSQLAARDFWPKVKHPELGDSLTYCGPFIKSSEAAPHLKRRAPLIGEHNHEIYCGELGLSEDGLVSLKQAGAI